MNHVVVPNPKPQPQTPVQLNEAVRLKQALAAIFLKKKNG